MTLCERCKNGHVFRREGQSLASHPWVICRVGYTRVPPDISICNRFVSVQYGDQHDEVLKGYGGFLLDPREGPPGGNYA